MINRHSFASSIVMMAALLALQLSMSACAVGMAASGEETPDVTVCQLGADRETIEAELGSPKSVDLDEQGNTTCTYEYEVGDDPSTGRAVYHAGMDVLTLGLWELVGTPVEAMQGDKYEMTVVYGPDGKAKEITSRPLDGEDEQEEN